MKPGGQNIYCSELSTMLLTRNAHFEAKKPSEQFALIFKSDSSLLLISRSGIIGIFSPLSRSLTFWASQI